ncbi:hypothetical protein MLGJGCBP_07565 [Rhodococcus sp. T7]|nr:hypothetical protein MLGJGCBP_07565 [Rhodococcus sp. T7]
MARHDRAGRVRRPRSTPPRTVRRHRRAPRCGRPRRRPLDRRPADRPVAAEVRHRVPETHVLTGHRARGMLFRYRYERAGFRVRLGQCAHKGRPSGRRVVHYRSQGLDFRCSSRRRVHLPRPHRPTRSGAPARRPQPVHRRSARPRSRHQTDRVDERAAPLQRGPPRRGPRRGRDGLRHHRQRVAAGHLGTQLRTQRPGAIPVDIRPARRDGRTDEAGNLAAAFESGPVSRTDRRSAPHVDCSGGRTRAPRTRRHRRRRGQGPRDVHRRRRRRLCRPPHR